MGKAVTQPFIHPYINDGHSVDHPCFTPSKCTMP